MIKVKVLNIQFDACTLQEASRRVEDFLKSSEVRGGVQIVTPNPEMLLQAQKNPPFAQVLNRAWMSVADGAGVLWASTFQRSVKAGWSSMRRCVTGIRLLILLLLQPKKCRGVFPERVTGVDLMGHIAIVASRLNVPIFLLGASEGVAEKVAAVLKKHSPKLIVAGTFAGSPHEDDFPALQARIAETRPGVLFVAYGSPAQELWIARHLHELPSVRIAMGVGGAFDFIARIRKRAPHWMRSLGLEWLYRLVQEPSRWRRIWNATVKFPLMVIRGIK